MGHGGGRKARERRTSFSQEPIVGESTDYALVDSGQGEKLERFGDIHLIRPAAHAIWPRRHPEAWARADARFERDSSGRGQWRTLGRKPPGAWLLEFAERRFTLKTTGFGHLGIFPEQQDQWAWIAAQSRRLAPQAESFEALNLFAYTGGSTLAAASAGAAVCHVDAARGVVDWGRQNAERSELASAPIRWIVEDVQLFCKRELRRGRRYQAIILDPPSFGRGPKGAVWKIEDDLTPLLHDCRELLAEDAGFVLLSCHSPGFTPVVLERLLGEVVGARPGAWESGEMLLRGQDQGREDILPSGCYARWSRPE